MRNFSQNRCPHALLLRRDPHQPRAPSFGPAPPRVSPSAVSSRRHAHPKAAFAVPPLLRLGPLRPRRWLVLRRAVPRAVPHSLGGRGQVAGEGHRRVCARSVPAVSGGLGSCCVQLDRLLQETTTLQGQRSPAQFFKCRAHAQHGRFARRGLHMRSFHRAVGGMVVAIVHSLQSPNLRSSSLVAWTCWQFDIQ